MKKIFIIASALLVGGGVIAAQVGVLNFDFIAPSVPGTSAAPNQVGLIVYDTNTNKFFGRTSLSSPNDWTVLGTPTYHKTSVYRHTSQSISPCDSPTRIVFDSKLVDTDNEFDTTTGLWTAKHDGYVSITTAMSMQAGTGTGEKSLLVYVNGQPFKSHVIVPGTANRSYPLAIGVVPVTVGTTIEVAAAHCDTTALDVVAQSFHFDDATFLTVNYIP